MRAGIGSNSSSSMSERRLGERVREGRMKKDGERGESTLMTESRWEEEATEYLLDLRARKRSCSSTDTRDGPGTGGNGCVGGPDGGRLGGGGMCEGGAGNASRSTRWDGRIVVVVVVVVVEVEVEVAIVPSICSTSAGMVGMQ